MPMPKLLEAMRPRQWSKNVFVLAGIVFAGRLFDRAAQLRVLACFVLFCAAASAVYLANDVADRESDAHIPEAAPAHRLGPPPVKAASLACRGPRRVRSWAARGLWPRHLRVWRATSAPASPTPSGSSASSSST